MLPTLQEFGIDRPVFLRKINSRAHWNPEGVTDNHDRARQVAERLFQSPRGIYSLWRIATEQEFYSVIGALSATRSPQNQDIDFIWMYELEASDIVMEPVEEGECLHAQPLHFNARIDQASTINLCYRLINAGRVAYRCKRKATASILENQKSWGCKAYVKQSDSCRCEKELLAS